MKPLLALFLFAVALGSTTVCSTSRADSTSQALKRKINELDSAMKDNCMSWNFSCQNPYLIEIVKLHELDAKYVYSDYLSLHTETNYKAKVSASDRMRSQGDFETIGKLNKFLEVRSDQIVTEFKRAENSLFADTELGRFSGDARINNVLKNHIKVLSKYKEDVQASITTLEAIQ